MTSHIWLLKASAPIRLATTHSRAEESGLLLVSLGRGNWSG